MRARAQFAVVPGALLFLYRRAPAIYLRLRDTILATWMLSVPIFVLFPCAPPRLAGIGMADTVSDQAAVALTGHSTVFYNPLAAVPSLHCGFAFAICMALATAARRPWTKALALAWGPIVSLSVVATGNHYVFDIAAGLLASAAGYVVGPAVARLLASRSWQFGRPGLRVAGAAA
jgi:membrane-associated phospholipid phosphatase